MKNKICPICEEESTCEYFLEYGHDVCCGCDDDIEGMNKACSDCFSGYASDVYEWHKDNKLRGLIKNENEKQQFIDENINLLKEIYNND